MARPRKEGDARVALVHTRVTTTERGKLRDMAKEAGMTLSDWMRAQLLAAKPVLRKANPHREVLHGLLVELNKQGSNLNQLTRAAQRKADSPDTFPSLKLIAFTLRGIDTLTDQIRAVLRRGQ